MFHGEGQEAGNKGRSVTEILDQADGETCESPQTELEAEEGKSKYKIQTRCCSTAAFIFTLCVCVVAATVLGAATETCL